jgi:hypothetical protein
VLLLLRVCHLPRGRARKRNSNASYSFITTSSSSALEALYLCLLATASFSPTFHIFFYSFIYSLTKRQVSFSIDMLRQNVACQAQRAHHVSCQAPQKSRFGEFDSPPSPPHKRGGNWLPALVCFWERMRKRGGDSLIDSLRIKLASKYARSLVLRCLHL